MFVQNLNKITLNVITNPSIMEKIKNKIKSNHVHFNKILSTCLCWIIELVNILAFSFACKIEISNLQIIYK
jgi:hypothetical protein